jgi:hypothetical protein
LNAKRGDLKHGFAFAGQNAYRINEIVSVKELISSLVSEYNEAVSGSSIENLEPGIFELQNPILGSSADSSQEKSGA